MNFLFICITFVLVLVILFGLKYIERCLYWKRQNIQMLSIVQLIWQTRRRPLYQVLDGIYGEMLKNKEPMRAIEFVVYSGVLVQDQIAIRNILVTQNEPFADRGVYVNERDPLLCHIARLPYHQWKPLRRKIGPSFTPNVTKLAYPLVSKACEEFMNTLQEKANGTPAIVEMYDLCSRFFIDVIGNVAFGVECNSFKDPNSAFRKFGEKATKEHFHFLQFKTKYLDVFQLFNLKYHSPESVEFFTTLVKQTIENRERFSIKRGDLMDILIDLKNDKDNSPEYPLTMERIVAQAFFFFAAGYNTSSTGLCEALYELAKNPRIQNKARQEVLEAIKQTENNAITYDCIKEMHYVKQIILETLRHYSFIYLIPRMCRQSCILQTSMGPYNIEKDTSIIIPIHSIHHNPEIYPDPYKFYPERFDTRERLKYPSCSFLAFGEGPKSCIAQHFSLTNMIACLAYLLSNFRFEFCEKTPKELVFDKETFRMNLDEMYLRIEKI
ncbi:cytochrome P450 6a8-like [Haematobia irritans]|uniref:cytochrome P450 6a8-like n=1 Tax=Haematobia irritans TaxID=7368 RepID=UPI003F50B037